MQPRATPADQDAWLQALVRAFETAESGGPARRRQQLACERFLTAPRISRPRSRPLRPAAAAHARV